MTMRPAEQCVHKGPEPQQGRASWFSPNEKKKEIVYTKGPKTFSEWSSMRRSSGHDAEKMRAGARDVSTLVR